MKSIFVHSYDESDDVYTVTIHSGGYSSDAMQTNLPGWVLPRLGVMGEPSELVGFLHVLSDQS